MGYPAYCRSNQCLAQHDDALCNSREEVFVYGGEVPWACTNNANVPAGLGGPARHHGEQCVVQTVRRLAANQSYWFCYTEDGEPVVIHQADFLRKFWRSPVELSSFRPSDIRPAKKNRTSPGCTLDQS